MSIRISTLTIVVAVVDLIYAATLTVRAEGLRELAGPAEDLMAAVRGNATEDLPSRPASQSEKMMKRVSGSFQSLIADLTQVVEDRLGWLRPQTIKEQALLWLAIAAILPWSSLSFLKPVVRRDIPVVNLILASALTDYVISVSCYVSVSV